MSSCFLHRGVGEKVESRPSLASAKPYPDLELRAVVFDDVCNYKVAKIVFDVESVCLISLNRGSFLTQY